MSHRPSGKMCCSCKHSEENCARLEFSGMRKMKQDEDGTVVVICSQFQHKEKK